MGKKKNNKANDKNELKEEIIIAENNDHKDENMPYHDKDTHDFDL